ncbi:MAG: ammonia-forming cytochrome c nitrite reductase subunit c552 [Deinococcales bacterium]
MSKPIRTPLLTATVFLAGALVTVGVLALYTNIVDRRAEERERVFRVTDVTEDTLDPAEWGKNYPRQYDSYKRTVDIERTRYGGSEDFQKLDSDPMLRTLFAGYAFGIDFREERGHAYMLSDQRETKRVTERKQPGACLNCHASVLTAFREAGVKAGVPNDENHRWEAVQKGFFEVNKMPYAEATKLVTHPVTCVDCHNPKTMEVRVTRPAFITGIRALAASNDPLPNFPSIERWRKTARSTPYDPNKDASRQELRSMVCTQCHVEYYFTKSDKQLVFPWQNGLKIEQIEKYYNDSNYADWEHKISKAPTLKAQHPEMELWSQGIHARSGVACADCHMPYERQGAVKVSSHHVRSPMLNVASSCQTCHRQDEEEIKFRVEVIQNRTFKLLKTAESATVDLIRAIETAMQKGASDEQLKSAREYQRKAQFRADFINAENSMGFHAPQEAARILAESIDNARLGQLEIAKLGLR